MVPAENNEISVSGNDDISSEAAASDTTVSDTENEEIYDEDAFISDESDFSDDADIAAFGSDDENSGTSVFSEPKSSTEGCIAVPEEQAQLIYQTVEAGIPVVIYK